MNEFMDYDFNISEIVFACYLPAGVGRRDHRNRPSHGLSISTGGVKEFLFSDGKRITQNKNEIIYLPRTSTYHVFSDVAGMAYAINFNIDDDIVFEPFCVELKNPQKTIDCYRSAVKSWNAKEHGYMMKCKADLYRIIYSIQNDYFSEYFPKNKFEIIRCAVDYIHKNYCNETVSVEKLSEMCDITPEYFRRIFKSFYGVSPIVYINNLKISRAKELLKSEMYSVTDAAMESGYADISYFSREFKKITGVSPSDFKNGGSITK